MPLYRATGIVLRTHRLGEADRIIVLCSPEHGKIRAVAKGVRKTKSKIGARLEPLTEVTALLWRGRELDIVSQVEVTESFAAVRGDLDRFGAAMTMLEIVDSASQDREANPALYTVLARALRTLEREPAPLLLAAFCLRFLQIEGVGPVTDACARCGEPPPLVAFSPDEGGFVCQNCRRGMATSEEVADLMHRMCTGEIGRVLAEGHADATTAIEQVSLTAVEHHLDRRLRSHRVALEAARTT
jgi:DNA repair protein RecO (recombination protein O)